ncbi:MAG TPA: branched-chain amino acid ABC transporter permease [Gaiellaceae bacterium]|jgi:branched-chain amino acid transport system permease protein
MSKRLGAQFVVIGLAAFVIAVMPFILSNYNRSQGAEVAVFVIAILGLNVVTGYTGQISIGHGAFMAIGGYTTAILTHNHGWNDIATLPIALAIGFGAGVIVGVPALRFHGAYLALLTFALALSVPQLAKNYSHFTGGTEGLALPTHTGNWLYGVAWASAAVVYVLTWLILRGRTGRAFRAVRDSEIAAASSGIGLALHKTLAFGISAAFAAVAGSIYVLVNNFVNPDVFGLTLSLYILIGAVVAGLGSLWGVVIGAVFIQLLPIGLTSSSAVSSQAVPVVFGGIVIVVMAVIPRGSAALLGGVAALPNRIRRRHSPYPPPSMEAR